MKFAEIIQSADWKTEKHVPVIEAPAKVKAGEKFTVEVTVGKEIAHPNTTEHHIRWIRLYFKPEDGKFAYDVALFQFDAHGEAVEGPNKGPAYSEPAGHAVLKLNASGTLLAASYCNIHGVWEAAKPIKVES
ncbi:MAG TPA: class II SORL domain-containing protein [Methylomusa anaerophila]|uniref:Putative superoxide reductase n=1 Tax=Methylomusa anaerophila TaxID=1930071 RepID=A0A348ALR6_9FIRM|nr:class II SORL domain-containing protein [Methylomusa anaerophila]BBB92014.1 putative superoxide reductase [Methylomusa anaerophila]HML87974.1 class II SORL domain-containing protein [Methylomusa anaerophila]